MSIIGFDVSKKELVGVRINKSGNKKEEFTVANIKEDVATLLEEMKTKHKRLTVAAESTSDYHRTLATQCLSINIPFRLINPVTTKQFIKATVRKKKTDLSDAHIIAKLALQGEGRIMNNSDFAIIKPISRTAYKLAEMEKAISKMKKRFANLEVSEEDAKVSELLEGLRIKLDEGSIDLRKHLNKRTDNNLHKLLKSIPGIGPVTADILIAEIGDIKRFPNSKSLVAFAGLDPKVRQSGATLSRNTYLTKRGSPYLRQAVYFACNVAQLHDSEFKEYFSKKRKEGRSYTEATVANSRRMIYRIYAVWKRGTPYVRYK